jgi:hypothetical protein
VSFFTLLGFIFLITQYFQFVRGYSALSAGVRLLPVAMSVAVGSVVGTQLAVRSGTKLIVTTGLVAMAAFYGWVAVTTSASLSYGVIAVQMVLYGLGMGLTTGPATESIMGAISRSRAGVGSAVNDATRLIGGTLGVAVIGSVYASVYGSRLTATTPAGVPGQVAALAHQSVGAAYAAAGSVASLGHPVLGQALRLAASNAFLRGLTVGALVAGGVAAAGAVLAVLFLPAQPAKPAQHDRPERPAQPAQSARPAQSAPSALSGPSATSASFAPSAQSVPSVPSVPSVESALSVPSALPAQSAPSALSVQSVQSAESAESVQSGWPAQSGPSAGTAGAGPAAAPASPDPVR